MKNEQYISVITCTKGSQGLEDVFKSLCLQTLPPSEWIIKDCDENSNAAAIKLQWSDAPFEILYEVSPDSGLSDGLNQALFMAKDGIICLLHNGDEYAENFIEVMAQNVSDGVVRYCDVVWTHQGRKQFRRSASSKAKFPLYDMPRFNHPTFVALKSTYVRIGKFNPNFTIAMDFDWTVRALAKGVSFQYQKATSYLMDGNGLSHNNFQTMRSEVWAIARQHKTYRSEFRMRAHWVLRLVRIRLKALIGRMSTRIVGSIIAVSQC